MELPLLMLRAANKCRNFYLMRRMRIWLIQSFLLFMQILQIVINKQS